MNGRVRIGKIVAAHGVRGLVKIAVLAEDPQLLNGALFTGETGDRQITLTLDKPMAQAWLASVEGVTERNAAELLRSTELWVDRNRLPKIEDAGTFYVADLIGLRVIDAERGEVGTVTNVENYGAGDLLDVRGKAGDFYLPFNADCTVDLNARTITVAVPADWIEAK